MMALNINGLNRMIKIKQEMDLYHIKTELKSDEDRANDEIQSEIGEIVLSQSDGSMDDEYDFYVDDEEVNLNETSDMIEMESELDVNEIELIDIDEPYKDSNGELYYICEKCPFVCIDQMTLRQHSMVHHFNRQQMPKTTYYENSTRLAIDCQYQRVLALENGLTGDEDDSVPILKPYQCDICLKRLTTRANLRGHLTTHSNEKPFKCEQCPKSFKQKRHLKYHMKIHQFSMPMKMCDSKGFTSDECDVKFSTILKQTPHNIDIPVNSALRKRQTNTDLPVESSHLFQCDECFKTFSFKSNLTRHKRTHFIDKPFQCEICMKKFHVQHILDEHMKFHRVEKSFKCLICSKTFPFAQMEVHKKSHFFENSL